ncbi:MAG: isochorismatase family protein [Chloroflexota bacterium]
MAIWDDVIPETERLIYQKAGFGWKRGFGENPALLIIDVYYYSVGDRPEPILKSMERYPASCGESGWKAIEAIASLLPVAREKRLPVIYTTREQVVPRPWTGSVKGEAAGKKMKDAFEIVREIAPRPGDPVVPKTSSSAFQGTPMAGILVSRRIDTVLVCGCVTSGCVRASVVDAASYGFKVGVIEECVFDRSVVSHKVNLFDMNAKYGDVVSVSEIKAYLGKIPASEINRSTIA